MPRVHTHYDNLKVARNAPPEVIRAAYRSLSKKYHPDHNPNDQEAIRIIQLINAAYEVLSNPARREHHDRWIARMETGEAMHATWERAGTHTQPRARGDSPMSPRPSHAASLAAQRLIHRMQHMLGHFARYLSKKA